MKKQSQVAKVQALLSQEPKISAQEMSKKLGIPLKRIYVLRSMAKKKTATTVKSITSKPSQKGSAKAYRESLEEENKKLYDFCAGWRAKCDKQESEIARIQHLYMDSQAVVRYLEAKLINLAKGN